MTDEEIYEQLTEIIRDVLMNFDLVLRPDLTAKEVVTGLQAGTNLPRERRVDRRRAADRRDRLQEQRSLPHDLGDARIDRKLVIDGHLQVCANVVDNRTGTSRFCCGACLATGRDRRVHGTRHYTASVFGERW